MKKLALLGAVLVLCACAPANRTSPQPMGGELPLDANGGGIDVVSGSPQPTFTGEARPAVGAINGYGR